MELVWKVDFSLHYFMQIPPLLVCLVHPTLGTNIVAPVNGDYSTTVQDSRVVIGTTITINCNANYYADSDITITDWEMTCDTGMTWLYPTAMGQATVNCLPGICEDKRKS